jgi:hypothetical protein
MITAFARKALGQVLEQLQAFGWRTIMSAYIVFTRTKTLDQKELETYWAGIKATMKGHPIDVLVAYGKHESWKAIP